jgi:hypothetical protein
MARRLQIVGHFGAQKSNANIASENFLGFYFIKSVVPMANDKRYFPFENYSFCHNLLTPFDVAYSFILRLKVSKQAMYICFCSFRVESKSSA